MTNRIDEIFDSISEFQTLSNYEKIITISFLVTVQKNENEFNQKEILNLFYDLDIPHPSNISRDISTIISKNISIIKSRNKGYYKFTREAKKKYETLLLGKKHIKETSDTLRGLLPKIKGKEQCDFLEEAISCFENKAYRGSIIMTWLLTIDIIYDYILNPENLLKFNSSLIVHSSNKKKRKIICKDDFSNIKESDLIEILKSSGLISGDIRKILEEKIGIRNTCAHPNSITVDDYKAIAFIQDLINNVVIKYQ